MTVAQIDEILIKLHSAYLRAIDAVSYGINTGTSSRNLTRNSPEVLQKQITYYERLRSKAVSGIPGIPVKFISPLRDR